MGLVNAMTSLGVVWIRSLADIEFVALQTTITLHWQPQDNHNFKPSLNPLKF